MALAQELLPDRPSIPEAAARAQCLNFPAPPADERPESASCEVTDFKSLGGPEPRWFVANYRRTLVFKTETLPEEESVLFELDRPGLLRPVWHVRFDTGPYAVLRSVTPEVASTPQGGLLLSVMSCVNGTGGCSQEFLERRDGRWSDVRQDWLAQLPAGFAGRIRHGFRIDPRTLEGEAGFYADEDPNCCPSQLLLVSLRLAGDVLQLVRQSVVPER